jgi:hypothetical protein
MKPCPHMKTLLSAMADGSLSGLARWYAENHARRCPGCGRALGDLQTLRERIRTLGLPSEGALQLSEERWGRIEAAWEEVDQAGT